MQKTKHFPSVFFLILFAILTSGCGGTTDTSMPQPGAKFTGTMVIDIPGQYATAGSGELELTVSADGAGIASASYSLHDTRCSNAAGSVTIESGGFSTTLTPAEPAPIIDGRFELNIGDLNASGQFISPTEATATIQISTDENVGMGITITCDFGSWSWTGGVQ
jgi:hypothetical protein